MPRTLWRGRGLPGAGPSLAFTRRTRFLLAGVGGFEPAETSTTDHAPPIDGSFAEQARETSRAAATRADAFRDRRHLPGRPAERPAGSASIGPGPATS